ncbi:MAG: glycoside hydrolase family 2 protein [Candidatus Cryptobacteroides sp.]
MKFNRILSLAAVLSSVVMLLLSCHSCNAQGDSGFVLTTPFTEKARKGIPHSEYPRPQFVRSGWMNLNGEWDYRIEPCDFTPVQGLTDRPSWTDRAIPENWDGKILVPFSVDSPLSGVGHVLRPQEVIWYEKGFKLPKSWKGSRIILHFQASDWETSVYLNGERLGQHRGGYDPFSFDITDHVKTSGKNTLNVCAWDATEQQCQAIGKQIMPEHRQGFRYQPTGGIWQTVWLEAVPEDYIEDLKITPLYDDSSVKVAVSRTKSGSRVRMAVKDNGKTVAETETTAYEAVLPLAGFKPWSPDSPFLYDIEIELLCEDGKVTDKVSSYFGMRKIELAVGKGGEKRIHLNGREIFQFGPLDQGYWPDGILTPPSDEAMVYDLQYLKDINANMIRVHIKTHPDRWYYHADRLGILVWQDMICMPKYDQTVTPAASEQWLKEFRAMQGWLYNHPSIVTWIVFNEAWGQHDTERITNEVMSWDDSRLVTCASGWFDAPAGNIIDVHDYSFYPKSKPDSKLGGTRASVIGEAGGTNLAVPGHTWYSDANVPEQDAHKNYVPKENYGFVKEGGRHTYANSEQYEDAYRKYVRTLCWLRAEGGCNATVHTQITDVEHELNGWMTYDRKVSKIPVEKMREINSMLYEPLRTEVLLPWGSIWKKVEGRVVSNTFNVDDRTKSYCVGVYGVNDYEITINGKLFRNVKTGRDEEPSYQFFEIFPDEAGNLLRDGENEIRVKVLPVKNVPDNYDIAVFRASN